MPFLLPRSIRRQERTAVVLAFGELSLLELCTVMGPELQEVDVPIDRVCVARFTEDALSLLPRLAGIHKVAHLTSLVTQEQTPHELIEALASDLEVRTLSVSGYDMEEDAYETIVRTLLDEFRSVGFRKIRLLRPKGNELRADEVLSRRALDIVAFPYRGAYALGPTFWVPDSSWMRQRGVMKPSPHPDISMSPRLASLLLGLAKVPKGGIVLDPFCGSGTILAEGLLRSCRCLGFDSNEGRVNDARRNLSWLASGLKGANFNVRVGDARTLAASLGSTRADAVVTEPLLLPVLRSRPSSSTAAALIDQAAGVYADALASMVEVLAPGGRIVLVVPVIPTSDGREVSMTLDGRPLGLALCQPGGATFEYPVRLSFESTRWVKRAVYVFESGR